MELPSPRKNIRLEVALTFEGSGATVRGVAENISDTGVLVHSPIIEPLGTVVRLEFKEFNAKGEIIWTRETDEGALLGMRIVSMGWRGWQAISGFQELSDEQS